jgi:hypothetical protein
MGNREGAMVRKSLCSKHTRHKAPSGVLALILPAAFAQGSARAEDGDNKNTELARRYRLPTPPHKLMQGCRGR